MLLPLRPCGGGGEGELLVMPGHFLSGWVAKTFVESLAVIVLEGIIGIHALRSLPERPLNKTLGGRQCIFEIQFSICSALVFMVEMNALGTVLSESPR